MAANPFDSIESAHEYVGLLSQQVDEVAAAILEDVAEAEAAKKSRRVEALRLVQFKLSELKMHLLGSSRTLNDLRALRRLLLGAREDARSPAPNLRR